MPKYPNQQDDWKSFDVKFTEKELLIGGWQVMQEWERPLMRTLAKNVSGYDKSILEIGFGMGICAEEIFKIGCANYTVIEAHPIVAKKARDWLQSTNHIGTVIEGFWENIIDTLPHFSFDGIIFDTYPLNEYERSRNHFPFITKAKKLLSKDGILTYYSDETDHFRSDHMNLILSNYNQVKLERVTHLKPPNDCEYWNNNYMIIPSLSKPIF